MSKFKDLLKKIGVDEKTLKAIEKAETDKTDIDLDPVIEEFNASQRTLYENDSDLNVQIQAKERAKILDQVERKLKQTFNLPIDMIKVIPVDPAKPLNRVEEIIKLAHTESSKNMDKNLQTVQEENLKLSNKVKELEETEIPNIKSQVEREKKAFKFDNKLTTMLPVNDLRVPVATAFKNLKLDIEQKYDWDLTDKEEVLLFGKGTKLQAKTSDGTKLLTLNDAMVEILKENKFIKESNADDKDDKKNITPSDKDDKNKNVIKPNLPHLQEATKHLEGLKTNK